MDNSFWEGRQRNPKPSECKVGDYYDHINGWQRRLIVHIDGDRASYDTYYKDHGEEEFYHGGYPPSPFAKLAHYRRWSLDGTR